MSFVLRTSGRARQMHPVRHIVESLSLTRLGRFAVMRVIRIIDTSLIEINDEISRLDRSSEYRWPLPCCACALTTSRGRDRRMAEGSSPTPNPGDLAAKPMAKIDSGLVQR